MAEVDDRREQEAAAHQEVAERRAARRARRRQRMPVHGKQVFIIQRLRAERARRARQQGKDPGGDLRPRAPAGGPD